MSDNSIEEMNPYALSEVFSLPTNATLKDRLEIAEYLPRPTSLWDEMRNTLPVKGVRVFPDFKRDNDGAFVLDEEGCKIPCFRCTFLLVDGTTRTSPSPLTYKFVSEQLIPLFGRDGKQGHLVSPVGVQIRPYKTKAGRNTYDFAIVGLPE